MAMDLVHNAEEGFDKDTMALVSGIALVIFGAGLILSNKSIRKYIGGARPGALLEAALPDVEKYLKLRAM